MHTIFLISRNEKLRKAIADTLAGRMMLNICATPGEVQAHLALPETSCSVVLVDLSGEDQLESHLGELKQEEILLLAILDDPGKRENAFRAGADDYLLLPLSEGEITAHLLHPVQSLEKIEAQRRLIGDQERGVSVGRLTSHICHKINNSMQATRGALALASEEPGVPENLRLYLDLCDEETRRVVTVVKKMRQIYHPADAAPTNFFLDSVLQESIELAADEMRGNDIRLVKNIEKDLPPIRGNSDLIQVALLSLLLNLGEALGVLDGGDIKINIFQVEGNVNVRLSAESSTSNLLNTTCVSPADEIITGQGGKIEFQQEPAGVSIQILFPISV
ncbi:MAG TPA: hypothetical protein VMC62_04930 [Longilinea sp.]|nr:hypothetical protein [Longilinea sp.]